MDVRHVILAAALGSILDAQTARPAIVGVANISLKTNDLAAARNFYGRDLGFQEAFRLGQWTCFKVNDHQYIEVAPELKDESEDRLAHVGFETTNVQQLHDYLASRGVKVPPPSGLSMTVLDPEGHQVEFVEYRPKDAGKYLPATRISERIIHVGFTVQDRAAEDRFYKDILGFRETWHGGKNDTVTDWIDMRVPEGKDWLEYMLNVHNPTPKTRGVMNHLGLGVPSVERATKILTDRGMDLQGQKAKIGRDGKWQLNLYDPNLTRAELMEFEAVEAPCCSPFIK